MVNNSFRLVRTTNKQPTTKLKLNLYEEKSTFLFAALLCYAAYAKACIQLPASLVP